MSSQYLTPAQVRLFTLIAGRKNSTGRKTLVQEVNLITLASLTRKGAVVVKGGKNHKYIDPTPLGSAAFEYSRTQQYLSWKAQLQLAREMKR